jgi:hypothetical protein
MGNKETKKDIEMTTIVNEKDKLIINKMKTMGIVELSKYADQVVFRMISDDNWIMEQFQELEGKSPEDINYSEWSPISYGNLAFICLNSENEEIKKYSQEILNFWKKH